MPQPRRALNGKSKARPFVDRIELLGAFRQSCHREATADPHVLNLFGIGGVGKTRLTRELQELARTEFPKMRVLAHDFEEQASGDCGDVLYALWRGLCAEGEIAFPRFDAAYRIYWAKCHAAGKRSASPFGDYGSDGKDAGGAVVELIDACVPGVKLIHTSLGSIIEITKKMHANRRIAGIEELSNLWEWTPPVIREYLPLFWAADLRDFMTGKHAGVAVFLDTYEAIWEGSRRASNELSRDAWVRDLVAALPEVKWVISGREPLRWVHADASWQPCIDAREVKNLLPMDARMFLIQCGIADDAVIDRMVSACGGHPFYLDLAVDHWEQISGAGRDAARHEDFGRTPHELYEVFIRRLDNNEVLALKVLACARQGNSDLFGKMLRDFNTGYPDLACSQLLRFSFFDHRDDCVEMHAIMRGCLAENFQAEAPEAYQRVQRWLLDHYAEPVRNLEPRDIDARAVAGYREASYHALRSLTPGEMLAWLHDCSIPLGMASQHALVADLFDSALLVAEPALGAGDPAVLRARTRQALALAGAGKSSEAESILKNVLASPERPTSEDRLHRADALCALGFAQRRDGRYEDSARSIRQALEIRTAELGPDDPTVATTLIYLSWPVRRLRRILDAEQLIRKALAIWNRDPEGNAATIAAALSSLAETLFLQYRYVDAEDAAKQALDSIGATLGKESAMYATALTTLAGILGYTSRPAEAEQCYLASIELSRRLLSPDHQNLAGVFERYAGLLRHLNRYHEAVEATRRAVEIRDSAQGAAHAGTVALKAKLIELLHRTKDRNAAEALGDAVIRDARGPGGGSALRILEAAAKVAIAHAHGGATKAATGVGMDAIQLLPEAATEDLARTIEAAGTVCDALFAAGHRERAVTVLTQLVSLADSTAACPLEAAAARLSRANVLHRLHQFDLAAQDAAEAVRLRTDHLGASDERVIAARARLGFILHDVDGRLGEAATLLEEVHTELAARRGSWDPEAISVADRLVDVLVSLDRREDAATLWDHTIDVLTAARGANHEDVADALKRSTDLWRPLGRTDKVIDAWRRAYDIRMANRGERHVLTALAAFQYGDLLELSGRHEEAMRILGSTLWLFEGGVGSAARPVLAYAPRLAALLSGDGLVTDAEKVHRWAFEAHRAAHGPDNKATLEAEARLAGALGYWGRSQEAVELFSDVVERRRRSLGSRHRDTLDVMLRLARALAATGERDRAEALLVETVDTATEEFGADDVLTGRAHAQYAHHIRSKPANRAPTRSAAQPSKSARASALIQQGRKAQQSGDSRVAEASFREALALQRQDGGAAQRDTLDTAHKLARVLGYFRKNADAASMLEDVVNDAIAAGATDGDLAIVRIELARHWNYEGRHADAESLCRVVLTAGGEELTKDRLTFADANEQIAMALNRLSRHIEAETQLCVALASAVSARGRADVRSQRLAKSLAWTLGRLGRDAEAQAVRAEYGV